MMGDMRETVFLCRTNEANLFVYVIAPPPDNRSADQQSCPE
jgi:hypothetical protein